jgi:hypothetical protein
MSEDARLVQEIKNFARQFGLTASIRYAVQKSGAKVFHFRAELDATIAIAMSA